MTIVQSQVLAGDEVVATMTVVDPHPMVRTTALGAAATGLAVLADERPAGASGPEVLDAERTLALLEELAREEGAIPGGLRLESAATATNS